jgi:hypothetical protein
MTKPRLRIAAYSTLCKLAARADEPRIGIDAIHTMWERRDVLDLARADLVEMYLDVEVTRVRVTSTGRLAVPAVQS